jgi:nucleotide sugar dehydrogenase
LEAAELTKLVENTFRFISIGFANEMARVAKSFGLNIWDIIDAAKTKPFGLDLCFPGLVGGHCLPIDPHYLGWAYRNRRNVATFVDVAERSHQDARRDAFDEVLRLLSQQGQGLPNASILFLGVAYKKNVGDTRESGVIDLMKKLYGYGAHLTFWDPVRARQRIRGNLKLTFSDAERQLLSRTALEQLTRDVNGENVFEPQELEGDWKDVRQEVFNNGFDCIVLATDHTEFQSAYGELLIENNAPPVADINNAIKSWLRTAQLPPEQENEVKRCLLDRSRFMLFGFD